MATPHYSHTYIGAYALSKKIHTIVEKPISVHKADCLKLIKAHDDKNVVFSAMFNQRTIPQHIKIKELIPTLGELQRVTLIATNWYRTNAYYKSGSWRATWSGEGGGILLNQMPHHLDLVAWLCGMPCALRAFCEFGKYHPIEVEDDVNATLFYPNGAVGNIITTTGEAPGIFHLEIAGDNGLLIFQDGIIKVIKNKVGTAEFNRTTIEPWADPEIEGVYEYKEEFVPHLFQHAIITQNVIDAIREGKTLIAPA